MREGRIFVIVVLIMFSILMGINYMAAPEAERDQTHLVIIVILLLIALFIWMWIRRDDRAQHEEPKTPGGSLSNIDSTMETVEAPEETLVDASGASTETVDETIAVVDEEVIEVIESEDDEIVAVVDEEVIEVIESEDGETVAVIEETTEEIVEVTDDTVEVVEEIEVTEEISEEVAVEVDDEVVAISTEVEEVSIEAVEETDIVEESTEDILAEESEDTDLDAPELAVASKTVSGDDDLTIIEGIGPKYSEALRNAGIDTFAKIADCSLADLQEAAKSAGMRGSASMATWAEQAKLAATGDWEALEALQDQLTGGRRA